MTKSNKVVIRNRFQRESVQFKTEGESMTEQCHKDECNINSLLAKYDKTGFIRNLNPNQPFYGEFSQDASLQENIHIARDVEDYFKKLPADVRTLFNNKATNLVEALADNSMDEKLRELGIRENTRQEKKEIAEPVARDDDYDPAN